MKRWDGGMMILRWVLVRVLEAARGFRLKGHKDMKRFLECLKRHSQGTTAAQPTAIDDNVQAA